MIFQSSFFSFSFFVLLLCTKTKDLTFFSDKLLFICRLFFVHFFSVRTSSSSRNKFNWKANFPFTDLWLADDDDIRRFLRLVLPLRLPPSSVLVDSKRSIIFVETGVVGVGVRHGIFSFAFFAPSWIFSFPISFIDFSISLNRTRKPTFFFFFLVWIAFVRWTNEKSN